jgi:hypothetical protein
MVGRTALLSLLIGLISLAPPAAMAACQASIIGNLSVHDVSTGQVNDPVPLLPGHAVDGIQNNAASNGIAPPAGGLNINGEGLAERIADILIYDATGASGANFCFNAGTLITITFNGTLTKPGIGASLATVDNMDVYDSSGMGGLSINSAVVQQVFAANSAQTQITIRVGGAGTSAAVAGPTTVLYAPSAAAAGGQVGAALRIKNLRIDATSVAGNSGSPVTVAIAEGNSPVAVILGAPGGPLQNAVATKLLTISNTQQPAEPVAGGIASGIQSSGQGLRGGVQGFSFVPGFANAFRLRGDTCQTGTSATPGACLSQVANDIATSPTSLVFMVTGIPSGVTVTFPPKIDTTAANTATNALTFVARGSALSNNGAPGSLTVIYETVGSGAAPGTQQIETAEFADAGTLATSSSNPNCASPNGASNCNSNPKIGVLIGRNSGAGMAQIAVAVGPASTSLFAGDDAANPGIIPRYAGSSTPGGGTWPGGGASNSVFTRYIVPLHDFFLVVPTRTTLLFPLVSTVGGFNTGISIVNACQDTLGSAGNSVYGTFDNSACDQTGAITLFFFGKDPSLGGARVQVGLNTDLTVGGTNVGSACRGFDATGRVTPGSVVACSVSGLLPLLPGSPGGFEGYVIAVTGFNNAHGASAQFNSAGSPYGVLPAIVMPNSNRPASGESLGH